MTLKTFTYIKNSKNSFSFFICDSRWNVESVIPVFTIDKLHTNYFIEVTISSTHDMYNAFIKYHKHPLIACHLSELNTTSVLVKEKICNTLQNLNLQEQLNQRTSIIFSNDFIEGITV